MNKIIILGILLLSIVLVLANENHQSEIEEGKKLVESAISCDKLNNEQLEAIGDYYMEQMHPGKSHELMHEMMGGHDSELTKNMHVNMAESIYCGETNQSMMGMMSMMNGSMMSGGMMSSGMMAGGGMMGSGMMSNYYQNSYQNNPIFQVFFYIILILIIITLILVIMLLINKLKNSSKQRGGNMRK